MKASKMLTDVDELFNNDMEDKDFQLGVQAEINKLCSVISIKRKKKAMGGQLN